MIANIEPWSGAAFWVILLAGMILGAAIAAVAVGLHRDRNERCEDEALRALKRIVIGVRCGWPKEHVLMVAEHAVDRAEHEPVL